MGCFHFQLLDEALILIDHRKSMCLSKLKVWPLHKENYDFSGPYTIDNESLTDEEDINPRGRHSGKEIAEGDGHSRRKGL